MKILNILLLISCAVFMGVNLYPTITNVTSIDAVINTNFITVRNEIPGFVDLPARVRPGAALKKGTLLYRVENQRYGNVESMAQYYGLKNQLANIIAERRSLEIELVQLRKNHNRLRILADKQIVAKERLEQTASNLSRVSSLIEIRRAHEQETIDSIDSVSRQLDLMRSEAGESPYGGVVWSTAAQSNEFKGSNSQILTIVNRENIWVDAYFSEKHAKLIMPDVPVIIEVIADGRKLHGRIDFVRAGIGRIAFDSPVESPPENFQERMVVARIVIDAIGAFTAEEFYGVGRSVRVTIAPPQELQT